jgi:hypothetical protein
MTQRMKALSACHFESINARRSGNSLPADGFNSPAEADFKLADKHDQPVAL